jgi:transposase-like protein
MSEHLGYDKNEPVGRNRGNSRNGKRSKTVLTDACGDVEIDVPRDRDATFTPVVVKKRQRRLSDVDEVVLSLYAKGLTTGEISAHFADVYGASVSKDTVSKITDRVIEQMQAWWSRPLERVYAAIFIDDDRCVRCHLDRGFYTTDPPRNRRRRQLNLEREGAKDVVRMVFPGRKKPLPSS